MKLEQSFDVAAPLDRVWTVLVDVEHVAPCLPGAAVTGRNEDGTYVGTFTVKIGPTTASYAGTLQMENVDEATHSATMHAHGNDKRGQGGADADIFSALTPTNGGTHVEVIADYHLTGRLARFGRGGMIEDISARLLRQFAERLQASLVEDDVARRAGPAGVASAAAPGARGPEPAAPAGPGPAAESWPEPAPHVGPEPAAEPGSASEARAGPAAEAGPEPSAAPEPLDALPLVSSVIVDRAHRNAVPGAVFAGLLVALLIFWWSRRRAA